MTGSACLAAISDGNYCPLHLVHAKHDTKQVEESAAKVRDALRDHLVPVVPKKMTCLTFEKTELAIPLGLATPKYEQPEDCPICMEPLIQEGAKKLFPLACGHWIHPHCLKEMFSMNCPMCRQPMKGLGISRAVRESIEENIRRKEAEDIAQYEQQLRDTYGDPNDQMTMEDILYALVERHAPHLLETH